MKLYVFSHARNLPHLYAIEVYHEHTHTLTNTCKHINKNTCKHTNTDTHAKTHMYVIVVKGRNHEMIHTY